MTVTRRTALKVVADLDSGRRDLAQGKEIADRIEAVLSRNEGLEAFPYLKEGHARAETVENGTASNSYSYDAGGQLTLSNSYSYAFDNNGNSSSIP